MQFKFLGKTFTISLFSFAVVTYITFLFLPRVIKKGMFGDGVLYASMARNLSIGKGSFWSPYFSSSYWIEGIPTTYYENPPLMLWIQACFFGIFGDQWWVEKLFCGVFVIINMYLFSAVWKIIFRDHPLASSYHLLPSLFWYLIPISIWGNVNNTMDNVMLSFCLLSILSFFKFKTAQRLCNLWLIMSGLTIFLACLTKGPVGLYPLSIPILFAICFDAKMWRTNLLTTIYLLFIVVVSFILLFTIVPDSYEFFGHYWHQRLKGVLTGERTDMRLIGWERFYIIKQIGIQLSVLISVGILLITLSIYNQKRFLIPIYNKKLAIFFILIGLSATLPILFSSKQSSIYLIPGIPMFSLSAATLLVVTFENFRLKLYPYRKYIFYTFLILLIGAVGYSLKIYGKLRRDKELITDTQTLVKLYGKDFKILTCDSLMKDFTIHTNLQRIGKYELTNKIGEVKLALANKSCEPKFAADLKNSGYKEIKDVNFIYFTVWSK